MAKKLKIYAKLRVYNNDGLLDIIDLSGDESDEEIEEIAREEVFSSLDWSYEVIDGESREENAQ